MGLYLETLAYGIYLVTCCLCAQTLFWIPQPGEGERLRRRGEVRWMLVSIFCLIFVGAGGAQEELTNIRDWINIARVFNQNANMIMGDFVLLYRCYIVYGRRWTVIAPSFMLYLTGIAMTIKLMVTQITTSDAAITLTSNIMAPWTSAFFAITAAQNVLTTTLLVWRIWRVEHQNEQFRGGNTSLSAPVHQPQLRKVIRVVGESGLAYSALVFLTFVVDMCNSNTVYPVADAALQATGITFNVIIIRSTPRRDEELTNFHQIKGGAGRVRRLSTLHFRPHGTVEQREMIENTKIQYTGSTAGTTLTVIA